MKQLTTRQAVILLSMAMFATKIQRMPAVLAQIFSQNGWIFLCLEVLFNSLFLLVVLRISVLTKGKTVHQALSAKFGRTIAIIYSLLISLFFFLKMSTPIKGIHEFFVSAIFDDLDWKWFSIILVLLLIFMGSCGLNRIGRTSEIVSYFALFGFVGVMALAVPTARYNTLLPIVFPSSDQIATGVKDLTVLTTDFVLVLFFVGRVKENKFKTAITVSYLVTAVAIIFFCITYYCIYNNLATYPPIAISSITEFSLFALSLGRIDWICVLLVISSSVVAAGLFTNVSVESFAEATSLPKKSIAFVVGVVVYVLDVFVFADIQKFAYILFNYFSWGILFVDYVVPILVWLLLGAAKRKNNRYPFYPYKIRPKSLKELHARQLSNLTPTKEDGQ